VTMLEQCYTELGRLYMETVTLRQCLDEERHQTARMATELGRERLDRGGGLAQTVEDLTAEETRQLLIDLNERLMGRAEPRPKVENAPAEKT